MGVPVGATVGTGKVGAVDGRWVGLALGANVGSCVGWSVTGKDGADVGSVGAGVLRGFSALNNSTMSKGGKGSIPCTGPMSRQERAMHKAGTMASHKAPSRTAQSFMMRAIKDLWQAMGKRSVWYLSMSSVKTAWFPPSSFVSFYRVYAVQRVVLTRRICETDRFVLIHGHAACRLLLSRGTHTYITYINIL